MISASSFVPTAFATSVRLCLGMAAFLAAAFASVQLAHADPQCTPADPREISRVFESWGDAIVSGSVVRVMEFYADDATLVPEKGGAHLRGKQAIRDYYAGLLARHPQPVIVSSEIVPGCSSAVVSGFILYRVTGARKGTRDLLGGRFTTDFAQVNGAWRIVRHSLGGDERKLDQPFASSQL